MNRVLFHFEHAAGFVGFLGAVLGEYDIAAFCLAAGIWAHLQRVESERSERRLK